ncbi:MAG: hypothetical protein ACYTGB_15755, partial [Planctomycetota bacterium]
MSAERLLPEGANAPPADATVLRRTKLAVLTLLNSRTLEDFGELLAHAGACAQEDFLKAQAECCAALADWSRLRTLHSAGFDRDLDAGFAGSVRRLYDAVVKRLEKGDRSEKKMVKARRKAVDWVRKRCFLKDPAAAEAIVESVARVRGLLAGSGAEDWLEGDLTPKPPEEPPRKESAPAEPEGPVETSPATEAPAPPPPVPAGPDNRSPVERAADRLYGPPKDAAQAPAKAPAGSEEAEDPEDPSIRLLE